MTRLNGQVFLSSRILHNSFLHQKKKKTTYKYLVNRKRENKRLTLANYFLKQTTADFFINPTDDVFVDYERINNFATTLGEKYDTENDYALLGNCITKGPFSFVQGRVQWQDNLSLFHING